MIGSAGLKRIPIGRFHAIDRKVISFSVEERLILPRNDLKLCTLNCVSSFNCGGFDLMDSECVLLRPNRNDTYISVGIIVLRDH